MVAKESGAEQLGGEGELEPVEAGSSAVSEGGVDGVAVHEVDGQVSRERGRRGAAEDGAQGVGATVRRRWRELLLEGVAVLLGVLVAFGVESWGQGLAERRAERSYLTALAEELRTNAETVAELTEASKTRIDRVEKFLSTVVHAPAASPPSLDAVSEMLRRVGPFRVTALQRGALDDLLTSGGIELVRSDAIRRSILSYAQRVEQEKVNQEAARRFWDDHMAPHYYEHASFFDFMTWLEIPGESIESAIDVGAFHLSRDYSNLLIERGVRDRDLLNARKALAEQIEALLGELTSAAS